MGWYDRLRSIGCTVETADAVGPLLDVLPPERAEAFFLWAQGYSQETSAACFELTRKQLRRTIAQIRAKAQAEL